MPAEKAVVQVECPVLLYLRTQNPYEEVKKAKFKLLSFFLKNYFHGIKYLHANVQCVYIVCAKYQMQTGKVLIQVEFPVPALSENTKSIMKKKSEKKI